MFESYASSDPSFLDGLSAWFVLDLRWPLLVVGIFLLARGIRGLSTYDRSVFRKSAVGNIVEVVEHRRSETDTPFYQATVGYRDASGLDRTFVNRRQVFDSVHYFVGDEVAVVYNPRRPGHASIEDDLPSHPVFDISAVLLGLCVLFGAVQYAIRVT